MSKVAINKKVPDFKISATNEQTLKLSDLHDKNVVLYFYPKDNTPGCTQESKDFTENYSKFKQLKTEIFGISRDSLKSHENFKCKYDMPFELISDEDETLCKLFDVIREKNMYGKKVMGIERSTFIIDKEGVLRAEFRKVKVPGHVEEILQAVKNLK